MTEYENSKSDDQLEELLLLTEQMQDELDQKDRTIRELKFLLLFVQLVYVAIRWYMKGWRDTRSYY